jgi:hypothetical protein
VICDAFSYFLTSQMFHKENGGGGTFRKYFRNQGTQICHITEDIRLVQCNHNRVPKDVQNCS